MNSRHLTVLILILWPVCGDPACADTTRPNIILLMADDMGMGDTSAFQDFTGNGDDVQLTTPQMERLARMGVRFTDAHTPSSRCSPTRYALLTGRYPWRSRLKHWVLFGAQGDPLIEADRPTVANLLREAGYRTGMVGKWHVGLRYRRADGQPAAGWNDADLTRPLHTSPVDHGFDYARFTSRSHGTSGPGAGKAPRRRNGPAQGVGPGHIHDRTVVGATGNGRKLVAQGPRAYILNRLGSRHSDHAAEFLSQHVTDENTRTRPFFLYYPANSNHGPYTPDTAIADRPVAGAARTESGQPMDARHDFIYENDVVLGRLLDWLESTDDPRRPGHRLLDNTVVIFTSDNGAEKNSNIATGPFRSHKGSVYEGGHRVPFIVSWPAGGIGNSDAQTPGLTNPAPIGLQDLYATFADILSVPLPNLRNGQKGAEDSHSVLAAFRGQALPDRPPLFFNDHKEATQDHAAAAIRIDNPEVAGHTIAGQWKLFFDAGLLRTGTAHPVELFDLAVDLQEQTNLIDRPDLQPLLSFMTSQAVLHRTSGGHRAVRFAGTQRAVFTLSSDSPSRGPAGQAAAEATLTTTRIPGLLMTLSGVQGDTTPDGMVFTATAEGLGLSGGGHGSVNAGEALLIRFNRDVVVESAALVAGTGTCGGYCRAGTAAPVAIYCVDADIDAQDQSGILSDLGVLQAGSPLRLDSRPHFGVEDAGQWRLKSLTVRAAN